MTVEHWYRFEDFREADWDPWAEFEQPTTSHAALRLLRYEVMKTTPKGVWLAQRYGGWTTYPQRFVLREANKRWACPTIEEAAESWKARKAAQSRILNARLKSVAEAEALFLRHEHKGFKDLISY
jgi:hypothetical protein